MAKVESFILGKGSTPKWFKEEMAKGRVKMLIDEDDEIIGAKIFYPTKTFNVKIGDRVMLTKSGLVVDPSVKVQNDVEEAENKEGIQQNMDN